MKSKNLHIRKTEELEANLDQLTTILKKTQTDTVNEAIRFMLCDSLSKHALNIKNDMITVINSKMSLIDRLSKEDYNNEHFILYSILVSFRAELMKDLCDKRFI